MARRCARPTRRRDRRRRGQPRRLQGHLFELRHRSGAQHGRGDPSGDGRWGTLLGDSGLLTLYNDGSEGPGAASYAYVFGTSFSTPQVAGAASLMLAVRPSLTVSQIVEGLRVSARPHVTSPVIEDCSSANPGRGICTTSTCGAGLLDVPEALRYAQDPTGYAARTPTVVVIDNAEVRAAAALGADRQSVRLPSKRPTQDQVAS